MAILISHPHGAAVAQGFAFALERAGMLSGLVTGIACHRNTWAGWAAERVARRYPVVANRILGDLSPEHVISLPLVELASRGAGRLLKQTGAAVSAYDAIFLAHDLAVSVVPWPRSTTAVYAYEDGALRTFRRARKLGLGRIWDLPLPHYRALEELYLLEARRWPFATAGQAPRMPEWKRLRKDGELALATKICVASSFTRSSLERLEVSQPIVVVPYGFPVDTFRPSSAPRSGPFVVLSVGTHDLRKGTPYLLEAWRRAAIPDAELHLVGPLRLSRRFLDQYAGSFRHWPHVAKSALQERYHSADLLAFPTLGDGFGLVMQEAMSSAIPVMTTPCGGGPECITDDLDGWLVPPRDIDAIVEVLRFAAKNRAQVSRMGLAARARAERWTWRHAQGSLARLLA